MTDILRRHIELYEDLCHRINGSLPPFEEWVEDSTILDQVVNGNADQTRIVIHNLSDGEGYFWSCGGWYYREEGLGLYSGEPKYGPWQLDTAFHFGGDGGPGMEIFWKASLGFRPVESRE